MPAFRFRFEGSFSHFLFPFSATPVRFHFASLGPPAPLNSTPPQNPTHQFAPFRVYSLAPLFFSFARQAVSPRSGFFPPPPLLFLFIYYYSILLTVLHEISAEDSKGEGGGGQFDSIHQSRLSLHAVLVAQFGLRRLVQSGVSLHYRSLLFFFFSSLNLSALV